MNSSQGQQSATEYRVVHEKAGINSVDYYYNPDRAGERKEKLLKQYPSSKVYVQKRDVTEWETIHVPSR